MHSRWFRPLALALSLFLVACGGSGGDGGNNGGMATPQVASVSLLITDAPVGRWDQAIATITSVQLIGNGEPVVLFEGSEALDLLKLADFSELFASSDNVPAGHYSKIRLQLSDLVLRDLDDQGALVEEQHPKIVGNGKIDLNPRGPFDLAPGDIVFVELDFDMAKSLKVTETGNGKLILRPVIFVNIHSAPGSDARLTRLHGEITETSANDGSFRLCQTRFASEWDDDDDANEMSDDHARRCVTISTDDDTGIFNSEGEPQGFDGLVAGDKATAIGHLRPRDQGDHDFSDDDGNADDDHPVVLDAIVVEEGPLGTFKRVRGTIDSSVDPATDRFALNLATGQGVTADGPLPVQLYDRSRIFNHDGEELQRADIEAGREALVDGILAVGTEDVIRSPLVILRAGNGLDEQAFEGTIQTVDPLIITVAGGDRCVDASGADVFLVDDSDGFSSRRGSPSDLASGQSVSIYGTAGIGGCIIADTVIVEAN
jgi:hypothetical protein